MPPSNTSAVTLEHAENDVLTENLIRLLQSQLQMNQQRAHQQESSSAVTTTTTSLSGTSKAATLTALEQALRDEEQAVLREALYILQGISGDRIKLDPKGETIQIDSPAVSTPYFSPTSLLGSGAMDGLMICGEAGWLYRRIHSYIQKPTDSIIVRALQRVASDHLQNYLVFLTQLEQSTISTTNLRQLLLDTQPARHTLTTLAMIVDGIQHLQGADVLTALVRHDRHGDSRHVQLVETLLHATSVPWLDMLYQWVTQGLLLSDEFFVSQMTGIETKYLWRDGFQLHGDKVPAILYKDLVEPAFQIGKGIKYIRKVLQDGTWKMELDAQEESIVEDQLNGQRRPLRKKLPMQQVKRTILQAVQLVHSHILDTLKHDHNLMNHMFAMKQFLLMGQGDFYSALMDGLHAEFGFDGSKSVLYRYTVVSIVDTALLNTNASAFDDQILQRLHVKLLYADTDDSMYKFAQTQKTSNTVWDLFCVEYTLPDPLVAVVDPECMEIYQKLFLYLFGVKKVEYQLNVTWRQSAMLQHSLQLLAQHNAITVKNNQAYAQANILLRHIAMTRQAMSHFVVNLKSYLFFEVLEGGWKTLVRAMNEAKTLDEVVHAHAEFLKSTERKSMLPMESVTSSSDATALAVTVESLNAQIHVLLQLARRFCEYQHRIFSSSLEAADRANERRREAEKRADHGDWGFLRDAEAREMETFFGLSDPSKLEELNDLSIAFHEQMEIFIRSIDRKLHGGSLFAAATVDKKAREALYQDDTMSEDRDDLDSLRFLKFQLGSNGFYNATASHS